MMRLIALASMALLVTACAERDQSLPASASKADAKGWEGSKGPAAYNDKGWAAGNKTGWENHLRDRAQTQNEYVRVN